jgi:hypothetical protein
MDPTENLPFVLWNKLLNTLLQGKDIRYSAEVKQFQKKDFNPSCFRRNVCNYPIIPVGMGKVKVDDRNELRVILREYFDVTLQLTSYRSFYIENDLYLYIVARPIEIPH